VETSGWPSSSVGSPNILRSHDEEGIFVVATPPYLMVWPKPAGTRNINSNSPGIEDHLASKRSVLGLRLHEQTLHSGRCLAPQFRNDVRVGVHGECNLRMP